MVESLKSLGVPHSESHFIPHTHTPCSMSAPASSYAAAAAHQPPTRDMGSKLSKLFKLFGMRDDPEDVVIFTPWTMVHIAAGILAAAVALYYKIPFTTAVVAWSALHALYESKDIVLAYGMTDPPYRNSFGNSIGDQTTAVLAFTFAFFAGVSLWMSIVIFVIILAILASPKMSLNGQRGKGLVDLWNTRG